MINKHIKKFNLINNEENTITKSHGLPIRLGGKNENSQRLLDCREMGIFRYCSTEKNFPKQNLAVYSKSLNMYIFLMKKIHFWGCILKKYLDKCEKVCIQGYSL